MSPLEPLSQAINKGNRNDAKRLTEEAIGPSLAPRQILDALVSGMDEVGRRFQAGEVFVPEMLMSSRAMKEAMGLLEPLLVKAGVKPEFTAVIGTVQGDLHDIGKNLVAMMWKGANFSVIDLGTNVSPQKFISAARQHGAKIVGLSALVTTTMPAMRQPVEAIREAKLQGLKIVIGGAPITQSFADEIGADGFAPDAASAVEVARKLVAAG
ncbi:MAG: corrinoid protein [Tepidisphaeraceae bacterium]